MTIRPPSFPERNPMPHPDHSPRGMLPRLTSELSVKLSVSYVPWCDAKFSINGIWRPVMLTTSMVSVKKGENRGLVV